MSQTHLEVFSSEYHMLKFFGQYLPDLDVNASSRLAPFLYSYAGKLVMGRNLYEFLTQMESVTALGIDVRSSVQKGPSFLIFFSQTPKSPEKFLAAVGNRLSDSVQVINLEEPTQVKESHPLVTTVIAERPETPQSPAQAPVSSRTEEEKEEILKEAESLRDDSKKAASKSALETFALKYSISLSRGKTFDGMMEDLAASI